MKKHNKGVVIMAGDSVRGVLKPEDFLPKNLHPKAKLRVGMAIIGTLLTILSCIYMLTLTTITPPAMIDMNTTYGISAMLKNCLAIGYVVVSIFIVLILWYLMFHDCPLTPAAKVNYDITHDKTLKGCKVISSLVGAVTSRGSASSIDNVATALNNYLEEEPKQAQTANPKIQK